MVAKHVNNKNAGKPHVLAIKALLHSFVALAATLVQWLSIVNFNNDAKPPPKSILREFDVSRVRPGQAGYPTLKPLHGKI